MKTLYSVTINTPIGKMIAIADSSSLYLLDFADNQNICKRIQKLEKYTAATVVVGTTPLLTLIEKELALYFAKKLKHFTVPVLLRGTDFQNKVFKRLQNISYGTTTSYSQIGMSMHKKGAARAIGNANGCNNVLLIIPCHRIIQQSGNLGGYSAGLERKKWLLKHENIL